MCNEIWCPGWCDAINDDESWEKEDRRDWFVVGILVDAVVRYGDVGCGKHELLEALVRHHRF